MSELRRCTIEGCQVPGRARGMCYSHYQKWRRANGLERVRTEETDYVLGEVEWLLSFRIHPETIARQLGKSIPALAKLARIHGRTDLSAPFEAIRSREQRAA